MDILDIVNRNLSGHVWPIVRDNSLDMLKRMINKQIVELGPVDEFTKSLIAEIITKKYINVMIKNNSPVGVNAALTLGENMMQESLQSHHKAGLKKGSSGFKRLEEIVSLSITKSIARIITSPDIIVYPDGSQVSIPKTKYHIYDIANDLQKITVYDIMDRFEELTLDEIPEWYYIYSRVYKRIVPTETGGKFIRIHLTPAMMYKYKIKLSDVSNTLFGAHNFIVIHSPLTKGLYVDIHDQALYNKLSLVMSTIVGGLKEVESVSIIPDNMLTKGKVVQIEKDVFQLNSNAVSWTPPWAWQYMLKSMVPDATFEWEEYPTRFRSSNSLEDITTWVMRNSLYYKDMVDTTVRNNDGSVTVTFKEGTTPYMMYADLSPRTFNTVEEKDKFLMTNTVERHYFWYIEANIEGESDIVDIYLRSDIDTTRSYITSPRNMLRTLGYLAARRLIYEEIMANIEIDNTHIKLIVNNMTFNSTPVSLTRGGFKSDISTQWMTYATFEAVMDNLVNAAFCGEHDDLKSVAAQVLVGKPISIGTGGKNLVPKTSDNPYGNYFVKLRNEYNKNDKKISRFNK